MGDSLQPNIGFSGSVYFLAHTEIVSCPCMSVMDLKDHQPNPDHHLLLIQI